MSGYVYFISDGSAMKIGRASNVSKRMGGIQNGNPRRLRLIHVIECVNPVEVEAHYHQHFADRRLVGEWFKITQKEIVKMFEASVAGDRFSRRGWRLEIHQKPTGLRFAVMRKGRGANRVTHYISTLKSTAPAAEVPDVEPAQ